MPEQNAWLASVLFPPRFSIKNNNRCAKEPLHPTRNRPQKKPRTNCNRANQSFCLLAFDYSTNVRQKKSLCSRNSHFPPKLPTRNRTKVTVLKTFNCCQSHSLVVSIGVRNSKRTSYCLCRFMDDHFLQNSRARQKMQDGLQSRTISLDFAL